MGSIELSVFRREVARARARKDRDRLAVLLASLEQRAVAAWAGEEITPRADEPPLPALIAIADQLRTWIWDLADRGAFAPWGVVDRADLHDLEVPIVPGDLAGRVRGDMPELAAAIVRGGARARGWATADELTF